MLWKPFCTNAVRLAFQDRFYFFSVGITIMVKINLSWFQCLVFRHLRFSGIGVWDIGFGFGFSPSSLFTAQAGFGFLGLLQDSGFGFGFLPSSLLRAQAGFWFLGLLQDLDTVLIFRHHRFLRHRQDLVFQLFVRIWIIGFRFWILNVLVLSGFLDDDRSFCYQSFSDTKMRRI